MPSRRRELIIQVNQMTDALLIALVFWQSHALREWLAFTYPLTFPGIAPFRYYKWLYLIVLPLYPFLLDINGYYARPLHHRQSQSFWILVKSVGVCALTIVATMYFFKLTALSRGVILLFAVLSLLALFAKEILVDAWLRAQARRGINTRAAILVGPPDKNAEFSRQFEAHPEWRLRVVATLDPSPSALATLPALLHSQPIGCVVFNVPQTAFGEIEKAVLACEIEGVETWLVANFIKTAIARASIDEFHGTPILVFRSAPEFSWQLIAKRGMDIVGSMVGLLILGPLVMLPTVVAIRLLSPGPILFRQKRSGLYGRVFTMYKFRSMVDNAEMLKAELAAFNEMSGPVFKIKKDPRITPLGRFLRKTSIDELPQLWNVLKGEMSLVGPRPLPVREVEAFDPWHRRRLSMKPGLTCLWQISGRSQIGFEQWIKLDLEYIDRWSLWLDLKILLRTLPVVVGGFGAH
jgi:exopolysaccharide biosynthesis polyprenyl glycosylphosphotransferase